MKKILVIEDMAEIRDNVAEYLSLANYKVFAAENGKQGIITAITERPDLIICDIMMPELDGYGVFHALHKNELTRNIPFIFMTAKSEREDFRKGMELGADDYITKPFSGTELLNAVEGRLKKNQQLIEDMVPAEKKAPVENLKESLNQLTSDRNINKYKSKQVIFSEGNRPLCVYFIKKGKVKIFKTNDDGKDLVVGLFNAGDFLGHIALLENSNYRETAEAMDATELAIIPKDDFVQFVNSHPEANRMLMQMLTKSIAEKEDQLIGLAYNSLRKKVAAALLTIYNKYHDDSIENFSLNISRDSLAALAGTATESLIRTLTDFKNEKLIDLKEGIIFLLNIKALQKI